jgi:phage antirepressor YoqD-like protein
VNYFKSYNSQQAKDCQDMKQSKYTTWLYNEYYLHNDDTANTDHGLDQNCETTLIKE